MGSPRAACGLSVLGACRRSGMRQGCAAARVGGGRRGVCGSVAPPAEAPGGGRKMPLGPHNPSCCDPQGWRHRGLSDKCVVYGLNSHLCVCHGSRGSGARGLPRPIKTPPNVSFAFCFLVSDHLAGRASWEPGPSKSAELWGSAKCSVCTKLPKC